MKIAVNILMGILTAAVAWWLFKNVLAAVFFGAVLSGLITWWQARD